MFLWIVAIELVGAWNMAFLKMPIVPGINKHDQLLLVLRVAKELDRFAAINRLQPFLLQTRGHNLQRSVSRSVCCRGGANSGRASAGSGFRRPGKIIPAQG